MLGQIQEFNNIACLTASDIPNGSGDPPSASDIYYPFPPGQQPQWPMLMRSLPASASHAGVLHLLERADSAYLHGESCVGSIFISVRHHACVNFKSEQALQHAIEHCDGTEWSSDEPQSPRIRCCEWKPDGFRATPGTGMYVVHQGSEVCSDDDESPTREDEQRSLDSPLAVKPYFPQRYFVLKSKTKVMTDNASIVDRTLTAR